MGILSEASDRLGLSLSEGIDPTAGIGSSRGLGRGALGSTGIAATKQGGITGSALNSASAARTNGGDGSELGWGGGIEINLAGSPSDKLGGGGGKRGGGSSRGSAPAFSSSTPSTFKPGDDTFTPLYKAILAEQEIGAEFYKKKEDALKDGFFNRALELGATPKEIAAAGGPPVSVFIKIAGKLGNKSPSSLLGAVISSTAKSMQQSLERQAIYDFYKNLKLGDARYKSEFKKRKERVAASFGHTLPEHSAEERANSPTPKKPFEEQIEIRNTTPSFGDGRTLTDAVEQFKIDNADLKTGSGMIDYGAFYNGGDGVGINDNESSVATPGGGSNNPIGADVGGSGITTAGVVDRTSPSSYYPVVTPTDKPKPRTTTEFPGRPSGIVDTAGYSAEDAALVNETIRIEQEQADAFAAAEKQRLAGIAAEKQRLAGIAEDERFFAEIEAEDNRRAEAEALAEEQRLAVIAAEEQRLADAAAIAEDKRIADAAAADAMRIEQEQADAYAAAEEKRIAAEELRDYIEEGISASTGIRNSILRGYENFYNGEYYEDAADAQFALTNYQLRAQNVSDLWEDWDVGAPTSTPFVDPFVDWDVGAPTSAPYVDPNPVHDDYGGNYAQPDTSENYNDAAFGPGGPGGGWNRGGIIKQPTDYDFNKLSNYHNIGGPVAAKRLLKEQKGIMSPEYLAAGHAAIRKAKGGKLEPIHIKKANEGKFTAKAKAAGMGVQGYARKVMSAPVGRYPPGLRKEANFARNAAKWNSDGGITAQSNFPGEPRGTDTVPTWLTPGEFVVNRASSAKFADTLKQINDWRPKQGTTLGKQKRIDNKRNGR